MLRKLNFFTKAIRPGCVFVRRLYDAPFGVTQPHHYLRITQTMREDIFMLYMFLEGFYVVIYFLEEKRYLNLSTDSSEIRLTRMRGIFKWGMMFLYLA